MPPFIRTVPLFSYNHHEITINHHTLQFLSTLLWYSKCMNVICLGDESQVFVRCLGVLLTSEQ